MMKQPKEPRKRITIEHSSRCPRASFTNIPLDQFVAWCKETAGGGLDISISFGLDGDWDYDGCSCAPYLEVCWNEEIDNPHYEKEMKKCQLLSAQD
jgi:hypothetical protein